MQSPSFAHLCDLEAPIQSVRDITTILIKLVSDAVEQPSIREEEANALLFAVHHVRETTYEPSSASD